MLSEIGYKLLSKSKNEKIDLLFYSEVQFLYFFSFMLSVEQTLTFRTVVT